MPKKWRNRKNKIIDIQLLVNRIKNHLFTWVDNINYCGGTAYLLSPKWLTKASGIGAWRSSLHWATKFPSQKSWREGSQSRAARMEWARYSAPASCLCTAQVAGVCVGSPGRSDCVRLSAGEQGDSRVRARGLTTWRPAEPPLQMNCPNGVLHATAVCPGFLMSISKKQ